MVNQATNIQQNFKNNLKKTKNIFKITLEDIFLNCKIHNSPSEGSAKESRRAGAAEYVTKDKSLCGSHQAGTAEYVKPMRFKIQNSKFKIQN